MVAAPAEPPRPPEVTEEDMVFIAAAVAAYLGVRARIRQVRLVQSSAWAQVGRATIHASHRVH
jgi:methylmalonyl-CoA carboxyltransferase large subunit